MMQVQCDECGKKYRIDESKIPAGQRARFKCKACGEVIVVVRQQSPQTVPDSAADSAAPSQSSSEQGDFSGSGAKEQFQKSSVASLAGTDDPGSSQTEPSDQGLGTQSIFVPKQKRGRVGLSFKVVTLMLLVSLIPFVTFWAVLFRQTDAQLQTEKERLMAQIAKGLGDQVDEWIDKNVRVLQAAAQMPAIISMDKEQQEPILKAIQHAYPYMYLVFTVDTTGMNTARNDGKPLKDYSDRQYYQDIMRGKKLAWQTLIGKTSKKPALVLAVPIKRGNTVVGVMANAMRVDAISSRIATWRDGKTGVAFLVDDKGKVVAHFRKEYYLKQKNLSQHPLIQAFHHKVPGLIRFVSEKGVPTVGFVNGTKYGWALAVQQDADEAFSIIRRMRFLAFLVFAITPILVALIAWLAARSIVKPIKELTDAAEHMSLGDLNVQITPKSRDEIGQLADAISRMQDSLRLSLERLRRRKATVRSSSM
ncbi:MAG: zinc-ribbon domain-containing protein [Deltaproteobacteria bacterium]|nr:zinc-ribbon domain-containing protein [Deltaproteobacteria bacterium]MBW2071578.1 zinc-ribbon domain-containing protein [Deltaproteobacteria bacterium]